MKKFFTGLMFLLLVAPFVHADDITKDEMKLPAEARSFIKQHFPDMEISHIKIDKGLLRSDKYEVVFTNGVEMEFDHEGKWKEIDGKHHMVPSSVLPDQIRNYISSNFSRGHVTKVERTSIRYEVELNDDVTLKFDEDGNFLKLDD
ncbi:MAG: PepSY-like domain-containing protein [Bacteroides sp.]|nr:PepSY-like domain-containing protein [Bacteroides sp.]